MRVSRARVRRVRVSRARVRVRGSGVRGSPYAAHVSVMAVSGLGVGLVRSGLAHVSVMAVSGARVTTMPSFLLSNMLSM